MKGAGAPPLGAPPIVSEPSPNHDGKRPRTLGCVLHSTRGGAADVDAEFRATLAWFADPASQVSAHVVIAWDGTLAIVVDDALIAWHCRTKNPLYLGSELVQRRRGDPISDAQYRTLAWWLKRMAAKYDFTLAAANLPEHWQTPEGVADGKSDVEWPFDIGRLLALVG